MSKIYKTWEMIEELSKNPKKKFKPIGQFAYVYMAKDGVLRWHDGEVFEINIYTPNTYNGDSLHYKWKEIKESVSWQEAIKAWANGKTIYCILNDGKQSYKYIYPCEKRYLESANYDVGISKKQIIEGKWYIED